MNATDPKLLEIATVVRCALEQYSRANNDLMFENFPRGTCGPVAELLGRYLIQSGYPNAMYVSAERPDLVVAMLDFRSAIRLSILQLTNWPAADYRHNR